MTVVARPPRGGLDFHLVDYPSGMWGGARLAPSRLHIPVAGAPSGGLGAVQVRLLCLEPSLPAPRAHTDMPRARGVAGQPSSPSPPSPLQRLVLHFSSSSRRWSEPQARACVLVHARVAVSEWRCVFVCTGPRGSMLTSFFQPPLPPSQAHLLASWCISSDPARWQAFEGPGASGGGVKGAATFLASTSC